MKNTLQTILSSSIRSISYILLTHLMRWNLFLPSTSKFTFRWSKLCSLWENRLIKNRSGSSWKSHNFWILKLKNSSSEIIQNWEGNIQEEEFTLKLIELIFSKDHTIKSWTEQLENYKEEFKLHSSTNLDMTLEVSRENGSFLSQDRYSIKTMHFSKNHHQEVLTNQIQNPM